VPAIQVSLSRSALYLVMSDGNFSRSILPDKNSMVFLSREVAVRKERYTR